MNLELIVLLLIFIFSIVLVWVNLRFSIIVLLFLSVLLHKEVFSIYMWDILPVRVFMFAFLAVNIVKLLFWFKSQNSYDKALGKIFKFLKDPFVFLLYLLWLVRGISILYSKEIVASIFLLGFFTTIVCLGYVLFYLLKDKREEILKLLKLYLYIAFGLCLVTGLQIFSYYKLDFIFGAFWNVPGHLPRIGSLFWDVNHFGALLSLLLPFLGGLFLISKSWKERFVYLI